MSPSVPAPVGPQPADHLALHRRLHQHARSLPQGIHILLSLRHAQKFVKCHPEIASRGLVPSSLGLFNNSPDESHAFADLVSGFPNYAFSGRSPPKRSLRK